MAWEESIAIDIVFWWLYIKDKSENKRKWEKFMEVRIPYTPHVVTIVFLLFFLVVLDI